MASNNIDQLAGELIELGASKGLALTSNYQASTFWSDDSSRLILFQMHDEMIRYQMQGTVKEIPHQLLGVSPEAEANGVFWDSGSVESVDQALELLMAWILEKREVADLPRRVSDRLDNL